ncbi:MAG: proteasome assembly chaperone family protein [Candidatus Burarchaeum sp.]|nr:proteasome assembly chaperone family protein [Candidatus Burarchaeum sp.]MDO8339852.1 proteasome assembly chaperone family protein [Candidatus Burarchaeum sp.]
MKETTIILRKAGKEKGALKLRNPVLIVGLPGIGLVGKLATEHMIREFKAEKVAELYSPHFPHQVLMTRKGTIRMLKNRFYVLRHPKKGSDMLLLVGDVQAVTSEAQYEVCGKMLDFFDSIGGKIIYTLGGYGTGKMVDKPRVFGSATHKDLVEQLKKQGLVFGVATGSIVGAAGMLLGLGRLRGMRGACLMGETHGGYVDAKCAQSVLKVLGTLLNIEINLTKLEDRAKESEKFMRKMEKEVERQRGLGGMQDGGLGYIR